MTKTMQRSWIFFVLVFLLLLMIPVTAQALIIGYDVEGTLSAGETGLTDLSGIEVNIYDSSDTAYANSLGSDTTNASGEFTVNNIENGQYVAVVPACEGEYDLSVSASFTVNGTDYSGVAITLQPPTGVWPIDGGITPEDGTDIDGTETFIIPFTSSDGSLSELELDIYLGEDAGAGRDYSNAVSINLPASQSEINSLIDGIDTFFFNNDRDTLVNSIFDGEHEVRMYEAVGFRVGQNKAGEVKENIQYTAGEDGAGTWTITLNTYRLKEDAVEFLVAVKDDQGAQWGHNNYTAYPSLTKAFYYNLTVDDTAASIDSLSATTTDDETITSEDNENLDWTILDTVQTITVVMDEPVYFIGSATSANVTMSGTGTTIGGVEQTIAEGTLYGTIALDPSDTTNKTLTVTPSGTNGTAALYGEFTFKVEAGVIEDVAGNANPDTFIYLDVMNPEAVYVDDDYTDIDCGGHTWGLDAFDTIQDGVDGVREDGTVYVAAGTYDGFAIGKGSSITVIGADRDTTIVDGDYGAADISQEGLNTVVAIIGAYDIHISGLTIKNSDTDITASSGIGLLFCDNCTVEDCIICDNANGIALLASGNNTIEDNTINDNAAYGVFLDCFEDGEDSFYSTGNTISNNSITDNTIDGVYAGKLCNNNEYGYNTINGSTELNGVESSSGQDGNGIYFWKSSGNTVHDNTLSNNVGSGIELMGSLNNVLKENEITGNGRNGIWIRHSDEYPDDGLNNISENKIYGNDTDDDSENYQLATTAGFDYIDARCNWWGTSDAAEVAATIDDADIDAVNYLPYYLNSNLTELSSSDGIYVDPAYTESSCDGHTFGVNAFNTIQEGIDAAFDGDTVYVASATYTENIVIDRQITLSGMTDEGIMPTIDGNYAGVVVTIISDNVTVEGFNIINSATSPPQCPGILLTNVSYCLIRDNAISGNGSGIVLQATSEADSDSESNIIYNNVITNCAAYGIIAICHSVADNDPAVYSVNGTIIFTNEISDYNADGIYFDKDCDNNNIRDNIITGPGTSGANNGIYFWKSEGNSVKGNMISDNANGMQLKSSCNNTIMGNTIENNDTGILLRSSTYAIVRDGFPGSPNNINKNNIYDNSTYAMYADETMSTEDYTDSDSADATYNYWGESPVFTSLIVEYNDDGVIDYDPYCTNMLYRVVFDTDASDVEAPEYIWLEAENEAIGDLPEPERDNYRFKGWFTEKNGAGIQFTATSTITEDTTLYAYWQKPSSGGGGGSSGGTTPSGDSNQYVTVTLADGSTTTYEGVLTTDENSSSLEVPGDYFKDAADNNGSVTVDTELSIITFDTNATEYINDAAGSGDVVIDVEIVDNDTLSEEAQDLIGDRPVYDFTVTAGDDNITSFGDDGHAYISIPYELDDDEDPHAIVIYYVNDSGEIEWVHGYYNEETGTVDFAIDHLSVYGIGYHEVIFGDVPNSAWYNDAVTFIAARGITTGSGDGLFLPQAHTTRAQFLVMLMRTYGIEAQSGLDDNFDDAGNTYYTDYLATAKDLGITSGVGDNKFQPDYNISRQDMVTMLYRALEALDKLPGADTGSSLSAFSDAGAIADYAEDAMAFFVRAGVITGDDAGQLTPASGTTRAEIAQVLYKLMLAE